MDEINSIAVGFYPLITMQASGHETLRTNQTSWEIEISCFRDGCLKHGGWFAPLFLNSRSYSKLDEKPIVKAAVFLIAKNFALDFSI